MSGKTHAMSSRWCVPEERAPRLKQIPGKEDGRLVAPLPNHAVATELVDRAERICARAVAHQHEMEELFSGRAEAPAEAQIASILRSEAATALVLSYLDCAQWANSAGYLSDWLV
ncbi:MAG: hypothetical protein AB2L07_00830 [Thermoanaerobaculaceae bacterium]